MQDTCTPSVHMSTRARRAGVRGCRLLSVGMMQLMCLPPYTRLIINYHLKFATVCVCRRRYMAEILSIRHKPLSNQSINQSICVCPHLSGWQVGHFRLIEMHVFAY